jgi:hypothetical protein
MLQNLIIIQHYGKEINLILTYSEVSKNFTSKRSCDLEARD